MKIFNLKDQQNQAKQHNHNQILEVAKNVKNHFIVTCLYVKIMETHGYARKHVCLKDIKLVLNCFVLQNANKVINNFHFPMLKHMSSYIIHKID